MVPMSGPKICICLCGRKEKASEKKRERERDWERGVKSPSLSSGTLRFHCDMFIGPLALESLGQQGD